MRFQDRSPGKMELVHDILQHVECYRRLRSNLDPDKPSLCTGFLSVRVLT